MSNSRFKVKRQSRTVQEVRARYRAWRGLACERKGHKFIKILHVSGQPAYCLRCDAPNEVAARMEQRMRDI